jgi:hypothetical protein
LRTGPSWRLQGSRLPPRQRGRGGRRCQHQKRAKDTFCIARHTELSDLTKHSEQLLRIASGCRKPTGYSRTLFLRGAQTSVAQSRPALLKTVHVCAGGVVSSQQSLRALLLTECARKNSIKKNWKKLIDQKKVGSYFPNTHTHTHTHGEPPASGGEGGGGPGTNTHPRALCNFIRKCYYQAHRAISFATQPCLDFLMMHFLEGASSWCFSHVSESSEFTRVLLRFRNAGSDLLDIQA